MSEYGGPSASAVGVYSDGLSSAQRRGHAAYAGASDSTPTAASAAAAAAAGAGGPVAGGRAPTLSTSSSMLSGAKRLNDFDQHTFDPPELHKRFVRPFPEWAENKLRFFDDKLMYWGQLIVGKWMFYWNLFMNAVLAIETGIALPIVLFATGQDSLAIEFTYVMLLLCIISQIPKRFLWRYRPFMQNRAYLLRKDLTSSFPSRAVTAGVVYSFLISYAYMYHQPLPRVEWWMPVFMLAMVVLSSYCRIQYGCHFPSDCAFGALQGLLVCLIATALYKADVSGCGSCAYNRCYASGVHNCLMFQNLDAANWVMFALVSLVGLVLAIVSVMPPLKFWGKCHHVYGILFPCIAFQVTFVCPMGSVSLPYPGYVPWWSAVVGIVLAAGATVFGIKTRGRGVLLAYGVLYAVVFWSLAFVRLGYSTCCDPQYNFVCSLSNSTLPFR